MTICYCFFLNYFAFFDKNGLFWHFFVHFDSQTKINFLKIKTTKHFCVYLPIFSLWPIQWKWQKCTKKDVKSRLMSFLLTFLKELPPKELKSADKQLGKCIFKTSLGHFFLQRKFYLWKNNTKRENISKKSY